MSEDLTGDQSGSLLEREQSLARVAELVEAAASGRGALVAVVGRPGEGKTALLSAAAVLGERAGLQVRHAYGSSLERPYAFGVVRQLLTGLISENQSDELFAGAARTAARVFDLEPDQQPLDQLSTLHGLYWLLVNLARARPLMLLVDDAHWADEPSVRWLASLQRRLDGRPVLVVFATRPPVFDGAGEPIAALLSDPGLPVLNVAPLSVSAVAALSERELEGAIEERFATACHRATGGNALAVVELLRDLRRKPPGARDAIDTLGDRAPETIARHVRGRLDQLGSDAVAVGQALAVLGERVPLRQVASLADVDLALATELVDQLRVAGIVAEGPSPTFEHPLIHAAVRDTIPEGRRANLHARAAALLVTEQGDPEAISAHLLDAEPAADPGAVESLREAAGLALRRGSPDSALAYLERALAEPPISEQRGGIIRELGVAAWMSVGSKATERVEAAVKLPSGSREHARLQLILAELYFFGGERERLFAALDRALEELGDADRELSLRIRAMRSTVLAGMDSGWPAADDRVHEALIEEAGTGTQLGRELSLNFALAASCRQRLSAPAVVALVQDSAPEGLLDCAEPGSISRVGHGLFALGFAGAYDLAAELSERMMADATARGLTGKLGLAAHANAVAQLNRGTLAAAEASARLAFELTLRTESRFAEHVVRTTLGQVLTERGLVAEASEVLNAVAPDPLFRSSSYWLRSALISLHRVRGERAAALDQLAVQREEIRSSGDWPTPMLAPWRSNMASLIAADEPERAIELASGELADARRLHLPSAVGAALRVRAMAEPEGVRETTLRESVATLEGSGAQLELARSLVALGGELRRGGQRRAAREPLRRALELAHRCAAEPLAGVASEELRAADGRPRSPWLQGVASLTPSEQRVVRLAASGASNQQIAETLFVTIKTVEMHLTNAYRKLGARSRADLPRLLEGESSAS